MRASAAVDGSGGWRCTGAGWDADGPVLGWWSPISGERQSPLALGGPLAFTVGGSRRCVGLLHKGRRIACPHRAELPGTAHGELCADCTAVDRRHSVAADTAFDDPRVYRLYLAWFGAGCVKVGITAQARGARRLTGQGALAHLWLGEGPLPAVRRAEIALGSAFGIPDRVSTTRKRAERAAAVAVPADQVTAELEATRTRLHAASAWPETVQRLTALTVDHRAAYGLDIAEPPAPEAEIPHLSPGVTVAGTLHAVVGTDAYLRAAARGATASDTSLLLSLRLLAGWELARAAPDAATTAPTQRLARPQEPLPTLFG
ncbi:DUF2797 domain-containing protein [Streptacidiphilus fuscans]|uniref:DUF2797 domain-containing protein n=1 Tax=Streptacidiphilus fuscans TaxID=2789292 RepID=A0A931B1W9_9ACTN|nr:DUF2797 domain-containing protein [Streptacidiphilus fuscans]MBF9069584.1 DUF2797 domain-containing protein [Streptacidiphilus fuscans]